MTLLRHRLSLWPFRFALALLAAVAPSGAQRARAEFDAELQIDLPGGTFNGAAYVQINHAPGRPNDLFFARQDGRIIRYDLTTKTQSTFATLPTADISTGQYWGLLGFTFAPDFATSGDFYVHVADDRTTAGAAPPPSLHHRIYIRRYTVSNPTSDSPTLSAATNILRWDQHGTDHSGGWIGFQPGDANTLWITSGDGGNFEGSQRDAKRTGQDPTDLLASILRINVSGSGAGEFGNYAIPTNNPRVAGGANYATWAPEVWSIGLRSPWGGAFDRLTGDFTIGDVGASQIGGNTGQEEVNFERSDSAGGRNYGWRVMEGTTVPTSQDPADPPPNDPRFTAPVYDYEYGGNYGAGGATSFEGRSVTGGTVYRGPINELRGKYIFGDWSSHQVWALEIDRNANGGLGAVVPGSRVDLSVLFNRQTANNTPATEGVTAFGEDAMGNLYYVELGGELYKIVGDVAGDFDGNGRVDGADLDRWRAGFTAGDNRGDADGDNDTDGADFMIWQRELGAGVPPGSGFAAVPEPSGAATMAIAAAILLSTTRLRR